MGDTTQKDTSQWMFLLNDAVLTSTTSSEKPTICKLKHPKTESGSMFLFSSDGQVVYEITKFNEPCRSWFIDQTVQHDGGLYITSQIDATFLALPYLIQAEKGGGQVDHTQIRKVGQKWLPQQSGKFQVLDQLITDDEFPECDRLCKCLTEEELVQVADVKGSGDIKAYRYNQEKALTWLKRKVEQVSDKLQSEDINVSGGSLSHLFVRSNKMANSSTEDYMRYAHGMVSDYTSVEVSQELRTFLGIKDPEPPKHEKPDIVESASKKLKTEKVEATEDYSQHGVLKDDTKKLGKSIAQNKLNKVDKKGMKSISSFFSPKGKK